MRAHPAIPAALALSGCYLSHGRDAPAAARDASVPDDARSDAEPDDAGPPPPPRCALAPTAELFVASWGAFGLPHTPELLGPASLVAHTLFWLAALVTVITGAQYWEQTRKALAG